MTTRAAAREGRTAPPPGEVPCRRQERGRPVAAHLACPYCFGDARAVAGGVHAEFCDFRPGQDPIAFGFPEDAGRYRSR